MNKPIYGGEIICKRIIINDDDDDDHDHNNYNYNYKKKKNRRIKMKKIELDSNFKMKKLLLIKGKYFVLLILSTIISINIVESTSSRVNTQKRQQVINEFNENNNNNNNYNHHHLNKSEPDYKTFLAGGGNNDHNINKLNQKLLLKEKQQENKKVYRKLISIESQYNNNNNNNNQLIPPIKNNRKNDLQQFKETNNNNFDRYLALPTNAVITKSNNNNNNNNEENDVDLIDNNSKQQQQLSELSSRTNVMTKKSIVNQNNNNRSKEIEMNINNKDDHDVVLDNEDNNSKDSPTLKSNEIKKKLSSIKMAIMGKENLNQMKQRQQQQQQQHQQNDNSQDDTGFEVNDNNESDDIPTGDDGLKRKNPHLPLPEVLTTPKPTLPTSKQQKYHYDQNKNNNHNDKINYERVQDNKAKVFGSNDYPELLHNDIDNHDYHYYHHHHHHDELPIIHHSNHGDDFLIDDKHHHHHHYNFDENNNPYEYDNKHLTTTTTIENDNVNQYSHIHKPEVVEMYGNPSSSDYQNNVVHEDNNNNEINIDDDNNNNDQPTSINYQRQYTNDNKDHSNYENNQEEFQSNIIEPKYKLNNNKENEKRKHNSNNNVKVVFNNNPQFIIGKEHNAIMGTESSNIRKSYPLNRKTRQPSSSLLLLNHKNSHIEDYHYQDESNIDETKIKSNLPSIQIMNNKNNESNYDSDNYNENNNEKPCNNKDDNEQQQQLPINVTSKPIIPLSPIPPPPPPPPPAPAQAKEEQQQQVIKQESSIKNNNTDDDADGNQQVLIPIEEMIKSGIRPPLRMVISMRNQNGDMMRVPVNFQAATMKKDDLQIKQNTKTLDENTPIGGDFFDPNIITPFPKKIKEKNFSINNENLNMNNKPQVIIPEMTININQQKIDQETKNSSQKKEIQKNQIDESSSIDNDNNNNNQISFPPSIVSSNDGSIVQMVLPKLTNVNNKTFALMFNQFQKALGEQIQSQHQLENQRSDMNDRDDEQEDLMVASIIAANQNNNNNNNSLKFNNDNNLIKEMAMTVIKPPRGTSIQDVMMEHSKDKKADKTIAILQSIRSKLNLTNLNVNSLPINDNNNNNQFVVQPMTIISNERQQQPTTTTTIDVNRNNPTIDNNNLGDEIDPNGFVSSSSLVLSELLLSSKNNDNIERDNWQQKQLFSPIIRFKRSSDNRNSSIIEIQSNNNSISSGNNTFSTDSKLKADENKNFNKLDVANEIGKNKTKTFNHGNKSKFNLSSKKKIKSKLMKKHQQKQKQNQNQNQNLKQKQKQRQKFAKRILKSPQSFNRKNIVDNNRIDMTAQASENSQSNEMEPDDSDLSDSDSEPDASDSNDEPSSSSLYGDGDGDGDGDSDGEDSSDSSDDDSSADGDGDGGGGSFADGDDEPYNQGASSERDYNNPAAFEIPQIDINPDTLKQQGCKTVLREVQEIPMNGLGVVQSNGQPGSGYDDDVASSSTTASSLNVLPGVRVRRDTNNLINSRKVTSIVMTKECHFPNEQQKPPQQQKSSSIKRNQLVNKNNNQQVRGQNPQQRAQYVVVQSPPSQQQQQQMQILPQPPQITKHYQQQQHPLQRPNLNQQRQQDRNYFYYKQQQQPQQQQQQEFDLNVPQANNQRYLLSQIPIHYQLQQSKNLVNKPRQHQQQQQQQQVNSNILTNSIKRRSINDFPPLQNKNELKSTLLIQPKNNIANFKLAQNQQQMRGVTNELQMKDNSKNNNNNNNNNIMINKINNNKDIYLGSDSKRNEVVAQKLYKPPSPDDPYHTLSYSSKTGADPDMDSDDDDSIVMDSDENNNDKLRIKPKSIKRKSSNQKGAASNRNRISETLSDTERQALMDPNYDDTDPIVKKRNKVDDDDDNNDDNNKISGRSSQQEANDDNDESDSDLADETSSRQANVLAPKQLHQIKQPFTTERSKQLSLRRQLMKPAQPSYNPIQQSPSQSSSYVNNNNNNNNIRLKESVRRFLRPDAIKPTNNQQQQQRREYNDFRRLNNNNNNNNNDEESDNNQPRFGKSFKFEHQVGRMAPSGLMAQLKDLKPGRQAYVSINDGKPQRQLATTSNNLMINNQKSINNQYKFSPSTKNSNFFVNRRQDDQDEDDEGDDDEGTERNRQQGRGHKVEASNLNEDDDPDGDPEYNPKESHLPANTKPKKIQKSFAYVHRDLPKHGSRNPDDFIVSYGRGNLQTEHEDYDSDRPNEDSSNNNQQQIVADSIQRFRQILPTKLALKQQQQQTRIYHPVAPANTMRNFHSFINNPYRQPTSSIVTNNNRRIAVPFNIDNKNQHIMLNRGQDLIGSQTIRNNHFNSYSKIPFNSNMRHYQNFYHDNINYE